MSLASKRELAGRVAPRYREARRREKSAILAEFVAATGYARKSAIRVLGGPIPPPGPIRRPRPRRYSAAVLGALSIAWAAADCICAKRLVPFLPELVPSLERHGHLTIADDVREQLLTVSPATVDRMLRPLRAPVRGATTTKRGVLLKHQIAVRTFADWSDARPGFMEADLVAHCGGVISGAYLHSLVLTDVATGWTECLALRVRTQQAVVTALDRARQLLPVPLLGFDTDNGSEFLNADLFAYCAREAITFTRGRSYHKDDQCFVEQKNGAVVRRLVGYDRLEGERAYRQLAELYRAARLYVNFFQPSLKLRDKERVDGRARRTYDRARTPFQRLAASGVLDVERQTRYAAIFEALDPVRLLRQIERLQDALWRTVATTTAAAGDSSPTTEVRFDVDACSAPGSAPDAADAAPVAGRRSRYRTGPRMRKSLGPRTYRTRVDPFAAVWPEVEAWLVTDPGRIARDAFEELQRRYPGVYPDGQLRTLQRRVGKWRARKILAFDDRWLAAEPLAGASLPPPLQALDHALAEAVG